MIIIPAGQQILVEIEDAKFWITPLTSGQRAEITHFKKNKAGEMVVDTEKLASLALKYGLNKAEGLILADGTELELDFSSGQLSDEHCDLLINCSVQIHLLAVKLSQGSVPMMDGVKVTIPGSKKKKKRKKA